MSYPPAAPTYRPDAAADLRVIRLVLGLVGLPFAAVEAFFGLFSILATDSCSDAYPKFVCSDVGVSLLLSPIYGGLLLGVASIVLAITCRTRNNALWWTFFGIVWGLALGAIVVSFVAANL